MRANAWQNKTACLYARCSAFHFMTSCLSINELLSLDTKFFEVLKLCNMVFMQHELPMLMLPQLSSLLFYLQSKWKLSTSKFTANFLQGFLPCGVENINLSRMDTSPISRFVWRVHHRKILRLLQISEYELSLSSDKLWVNSRKKRLSKEGAPATKKTKITFRFS